MGKTTALPGDSQGLTYVAFPYYSLENCFSELKATAQQALQQEGIATNTITTKRSVDLRYRGQSNTINIPWQNNSQDEFHQAHQQRYGHRLHQAVELVNIHIRAEGPAPEINLPPLTTTTAAIPPQQVELFGISGKVEVWQRETLMAEQKITGPALIIETVATTFIDEGWSC